METQLVVGVVLGLLAIGATAVGVKRRLGSAGNLELDQGAPTPPAITRGQVAVDGPGAEDLILIPLPNRRDEALVVGSAAALEVLDASGLANRPLSNAPGPLPQLVRSAMGAGGLEATRRAQAGVDSGRIVALSKDTIEHLEKGKPVYDKAANMLGIVKGDKAKISHIMRLDKAGAQAVVASNAATLAVTVALSQQLNQIAEQLAEISETLEGMIRDKDRERLAEIVAANELLLEIANNVRRRGITQTDASQLAALKLSVIAKHLEAEFKFNEVLGEDFDNSTRQARLEKLNGLVEKERLEYWLAFRVQADIARTRAELLTLYWEQQQHSETVGSLNVATKQAIRKRQERLAAIGQTLHDLSHPESRTRLDPLRQLSRHRLRKEHDKMKQLLAKHGPAFAGPDQDPYALLPAGTQARTPN